MVSTNGNSTRTDDNTQGIARYCVHYGPKVALMSYSWNEKAVYYRTTTGGKTKWVKINDVTYRESGNELKLRDWDEDTGRYAVDNSRVFKRDRS